MFYTKPAMRLNGHLLPVLCPRPILGAVVASSRGTDDPIATITATGMRYPSSMALLVRVFGSSPSVPWSVTTPLIYLNLNGTPVVDESIGNNTTCRYTLSLLWPKYLHPAGSQQAAQPYANWVNSRSILSSPGKKPLQPSGSTIVSPLVYTTMEAYIEGRKYRPLLSIVNGNQIQVAIVDNSTVETGFVIERSTDGGVTWPVSYVLGPKTGTGGVVYVDVAVSPGVVYA